jgi:hypothetical protein
MSMTNGRFNTSKCRSMLQKMGMLYTHSPQMPHTSPNFLKIPKKKSKSSNTMSNCGNVKSWPTGDRWSPPGPSRLTNCRRLLVAKLLATSGRWLVTHL